MLHLHADERFRRKHGPDASKHPFGKRLIARDRHACPFLLASRQANQ